ncbi:Protein kinase domain [Pelomyxa schiedti]|nr:Protein kinase domain [Pelomyxa schiedti]
MASSATFPGMAIGSSRNKLTSSGYIVPPSQLSNLPVSPRHQQPDTTQTAIQHSLSTEPQAQVMQAECNTSETHPPNEAPTLQSSDSKLECTDYVVPSVIRLLTKPSIAGRSKSCSNFAMLEKENPQGNTERPHIPEQSPPPRPLYTVSFPSSNKNNDTSPPLPSSPRFLPSTPPPRPAPLPQFGAPPPPPLIAVSTPAPIAMALPALPAPLPPTPMKAQIQQQQLTPAAPTRRAPSPQALSPPPLRSPTLSSHPTPPIDDDVLSILQAPVPSPPTSPPVLQIPDQIGTQVPSLSLAPQTSSPRTLSELVNSPRKQTTSDGRGNDLTQIAYRVSRVNTQSSGKSATLHNRSTSHDNSMLILRVVVNTDNTENSQMKRFPKTMLVRDAINQCKLQMLNPSLANCRFNFLFKGSSLNPHIPLGDCGLYHTDTVNMVAEDASKVTSLYLDAMTPKKMENISQIHRTAIKSGVLTKHKKAANKFTDHQSRWCVLNNNTLYYFANPRDQMPVGQLDLEHACVEFHFDDPIPKERTRFTVELPSGIVYYFDADSETSAKTQKPKFASFVIKKQKTLVSSVGIGTRKWAVLSSPNIYLFDSPADREPSSEVDVFSAQVSFNDERREINFSTFTESFSFTIESDSSFRDSSEGVTSVLHEGWLLKKKHTRGLVISNIKRRYCKLSGHRLYYMASPSDIRPLGFFDLYHSQVTFYDEDEENRAQVQLATHGGLYSLYHPDPGGSLKEWSAAIRAQCVGVPFNVVHKQCLDINLQWVGEPLSLFEIQNELGKGAYATVYKARHIDSGCVMAIKILPIEGNMEHIQELQSEIDVLKKCRSPQIVSYFGSMVSGDDLWIMMEHCGCGSVKDMMKAAMDTLSEAQLAFICCETLKGLVHLHSINVIHHDIKAGNILITEEGQVKIADFGLSQQYQDIHSVKAEDFVGSPLYMSPEVLRKSKYNAKVTDIWSLGITVIEMAEGSPPNMRMCSFEQLLAAIERAPPKFAKPQFWHKDLIDFVSKCLTREVDTRPDAIAMLLHPFLQQNGGANSIKGLVSAAIRRRDAALSAASTTTTGTPSTTSTNPQACSSTTNSSF